MIKSLIKEKSYFFALKIIEKRGDSARFLIDISYFYYL